MDMTGEYRIPAPRQRVWEALNDPDDPQGRDPRLRGAEQALRQRARGAGQGQGRAGQRHLHRQGHAQRPQPARRATGSPARARAAPPGYAKGGAEVNLAEDGADTILRYNAKADVGGKLAQIGSRLIQGTAKKMADDFFGKFSAIVGERYAAERPAAAAGRGRRTGAAAAAGSRAGVPPAAGRQRAARGAGRDSHGGAGQRRGRHAARASRRRRRSQVAFQPERPPAVPTPTVPAPHGQARASPGMSGCSGPIVVVILLFWLFG